MGRLTENKGIIELLEIFEKRRDAFFTIVGDGPLSDIVQQYARRCENITYLGYIKGLHNIIPLYQKHCFMVLNSKKTKQWEELFGIMLIEGMACGCVPISIKHTGPKEIITDGVDGFLYEEGGIEQGVIHGIQLTEEQYSQYRKNAIKRGSDFYYKKIMDKWEKIL